MILDNIDKIKSLLKWPDGVFYFVQVIQRKKENPDLPVSDMKRYQCFITSIKDLDTHLPRIKKVCCDYNARAYISILPRSLEKLAKQCLLEYAQRVNKALYNRVWDIPNRVALSEDIRMSDKKSKPLRMFDVDKKDDVQTIKDFVSEIGIKVVETIPTINGAHIFVEAFNPSLLNGLETRQEDYILPSGESFTYRPDCNTILYASTSKSL